MAKIGRLIKRDDGVEFSIFRVRGVNHVIVRNYQGHEYIIAAEFYSKRARFYDVAVWLKEKGYSCNDRHVARGTVKDALNHMKKLVDGVIEVPVPREASA